MLLKLNMDDLLEFLRPQYIINLTERVDKLEESRKEDLEYLIEKLSEFLAQRLGDEDDA